MCAVKIVTDSTSDVPREVREKLGIEMVPLKVLFGDQSYLDAVTLEAGQFYDMLSASPVLPTTSQPSPVEFMEAFERILAEDPEAQIISFHLSSQFSGTYQSAVLGKSLLERDADITIIDTKSASSGFGVLVVRAAEMAREGRSKEEILAEVECIAATLELYFLVDTLEYLQRGGRIGRAAALFGSILNIKPILTIDEEGYVAPVDKVRGQKKAMLRIMELLERDFGAGSELNLVMAWTSDEAPAMEMLNLIKERFKVKEVNFTTIGAVIGTHVGPGTAAVFAYKV
ncbi:DegV family protein [Paenibacillus sambharensis]|uniref:DegV family protein n=1 Tax=Paenibacillus sambharensis TaxID=1803190 RepID=A0A2W1LN85_9BACL|nr:DegV family protein [Paenibacillus sambharensis]PZD93261.1 DegV family protein [Paenibacillus sambharensis]